MSRKWGLFFFFLFLFSRLLFLNSQAVFFDSQEYLTRLGNPDFFQALISGHLPLHTGYIFIFWPVFQIAKFININPAGAVVFFQIILSSFSIYYFYQLIKLIFDQRIALSSSMIVSLTPLYWIANTTIMMETTYVSFFILSLYFWTKYCFLKKSRFYYLILSLVFFIISFLAHTVIILWLPVFLFLVYYSNKRQFIKSLIYLAIGLIIASLINAYFVSHALQVDFFNSLKLVYTGKFQERADFSLGLMSLMIATRNLIIPLLRNNTNLIVLLGFLGLIRLFWKDKKIFLLFFLWILPAIITNQWWDSLFFGRHALIVTFGLSFLTAYLINKNKISSVFLLIYLLIVSLPAVYLLKQEIPYLQEAKIVKTLPQNGLLIESHFARPQVDGHYKGQIIFVNEPSFDKTTIYQSIITSLKNKKPIFISSQALSDPYGLYSGPYIHSLTLSYKDQPVIKKIIENFTLQEYKIIDKEDNLIIYKIISDKPSTYPLIKSMKYSRRRLDYFDPMSQVWFIINKQFKAI